MEDSTLRALFDTKVGIVFLLPVLAMACSTAPTRSGRDLEDNPLHDTTISPLKTPGTSPDEAIEEYLKAVHGARTAIEVANHRWVIAHSSYISPWRDWLSIAEFPGTPEPAERPMYRLRILSDSELNAGAPAGHPTIQAATAAWRQTRTNNQHPLDVIAKIIRRRLLVPGMTLENVHDIFQPEMLFEDDPAFNATMGTIQFLVNEDAMGQLLLRFANGNMDLKQRSLMSIEIDVQWH